MADNTLSTWQPFLFELQGVVWEQFPAEAVFLAEMSGVGDDSGKYKRISRDMDGNRNIFSGSRVRHTIILSEMTGYGFVQEASTWNVPHTINADDININLVRALVPFSITVDVERDSLDNSTASAVAQSVDLARVSLGKMENIAFLGDGTGKVSDITGGSSPGLTITVGTSANFDILLPGTVWDVLTKASGANPGNGLRRKIASVSESAGTVTFDTNAVASDGNSGNITFSTNEGIYIPGSWSNSTGATAPGALCAQGLEQAAAASGTFENVDKANVPQWQGTDGRNGDTTTLALSMPMLDQGVRRGRRAGQGAWDFAIGDPAVIDLYKQGLYAQARYDIADMQLKSGFSGVVYQGADKPFPLIKDVHHKKGGLKFVDKKSFQLYGDRQGPSFLEDDGAMFRRFSRTLAKEADLLDRVQLGVTRCNTIVYFNNLAVS